MLLNCGVGEDSWESLGLHRDPTSPLEGLVLKLKLQYFGHLMWRANSFEKTLMLEKIEGRRRRGRQDEIAGWHHWLDGRESEWTLSPGDRQGDLACCDSWGGKESDTTERLIWSDMAHITFYGLCFFFSLSAEGSFWGRWMSSGAEISYFLRITSSFYILAKKTNILPCTSSLDIQIHISQTARWERTILYFLLVTGSKSPEKGGKYRTLVS